MFEKYIEINEGNLPLIFSVAHGGYKKYEELPKRSKGILGIDINTIHLAKLIIKEIKAKLKDLNPLGDISYIISHVPRKNIDLNRKIEEGCPESDLSKKIYIYYHDKLKDLVLNNIQKYNKSLLIDIHGFEKHKRPPGYRDVELILGTRNLETLFPEQIPKRDWKKNIRGKIIQKFLDLNIAIAPGHPRRNEYVLTGGYITQKYGASSIENSQALQIEFSDEIRTNNKILKKVVIDALSEIIVKEII